MSNFTLELFRKDEQEKHDIWNSKNQETNDVFQELLFVKNQANLAKKDLEAVEQELKKAKEELTALAVRHEANVKSRREAVRDAEMNGEHTMAWCISNDIDIEQVIFEREKDKANEKIAEIKDRQAVYQKVLKDAEDRRDGKQSQFDLLDAERKNLHKEYIEKKELRKNLEKKINSQQTKASK